MSRDEDELYELADDPPAKAVHAAPVQAGAGADLPQRPRRVVPIGYKSPSTITSGSEQAFADPVKDLYAPLGLIGGGLFVEAMAVWLFRDSSRDFISSLRLMGLSLCLNTGLLLAGIWLAARVRQIELGKLPVAIMKLCAVSIAPGAVMILLAPVAGFIPFLGGLVLWIIGFCLYFALIGFFFDLDQQDTWYCVVVIFLLRIAVVLGLHWLG